MHAREAARYELRTVVPAFASQLAMKGENLHKIATLLGNSPEFFKLRCTAAIPESHVASAEFWRGPERLA